MKNLLKINEYFEQIYEDETELKKFYRQVFDLMGYANQKLMKPLSLEGGSGDPFKMNDGKVLKITTDKIEAYNAEILTKIKTECFATYYKTASLDFENEIDKKTKKKNYVVLMDFLKVLDKNSEDAKHYIFLKEKFFKSIDRNKEVQEEYSNYNNYDNYWDKFQELNSEERLKEVCEQNNVDINKVKKVYDRLMLIMQEAITNKLILVDVSADNVAINSKGEIIVFDLGAALGASIAKTLPDLEPILKIKDLSQVQLSPEDANLSLKESKFFKYNKYVNEKVLNF